VNAYEQMGSVRGNDRFHPSQDGDALVRTFFPPTAEALALDLSTVTSAFYAVMLQAFADTHGYAGIDAASRRFFYRLGRLKARGTYQDKRDQHPFTRDVRDLVTVLIAAIYNASPEYRFDVREHEPHRCEVHLAGTDRYYRAAIQLGIAEHLTWPTLHPFFEGAADELGIAAEVHSEVLTTGANAELHTRYVFSAR